MLLDRLCYRMMSLFPKRKVIHKETTHGETGCPKKQVTDGDNQ